MKVTVITAVYNRAADLEKTMQSVLRLACPGLDYIVIDGGSTDGSFDLIKSYSGQLKYWLSEPDRGVYDAMNKGWSLADPESHILFLGAGDRLLCLPEESHSGQGSNPVVLYGNVQLEKGQIFHARADFFLRLFNTLHHQALLIPKCLHPDPPFNIEYTLYADFDFNQRLNKAGVQFCFDENLLAYAAPGGMTDKLQLKELTAIISKNYGFFWSMFSMAGFLLARRLRIIGKLRPIR